MKSMLRTALAALSIASIGPAFGGEGGDVAANTFFTQLPGVIAQAPAQDASAIATAQNGQDVQLYGTMSHRGTWLFAPTEYGG